VTVPRETAFPRAIIDGDALRHNLSVVRRTAPESQVLAVVKANAYGHGLAATAHALASADALGVARLAEGLALRAAGINNRIVLLEGVFSPEELQRAAQAQLELVVHTVEQVELLEAADATARFDVWVKIDTGMNRLGFRIEDFASAWSRVRRCKSVTQLRAMTHLAAAEDRESDTPRQLERFDASTSTLQVERSVANSAGLVTWPQARLDWVRPGLMLYGISPVPDRSADQLGLRPAMTLTTQLIAIRHVPAGEGVGYNSIWRATADSIIGIAAVGYGDGYPRNFRSGAPVLVNAAETKVVGRVSMDMTAIDLTHLPACRIGDEVTLWGKGLGADRVAPFAGTIAYELICGISQRVAVDWKNR
jgi:alanine racemase